ncbi:hypothetical protein SAMN02910275_01659 [Butyrivibrio sp. INlla18]|uniref:hypothetical protein n=1 Tax=Butyrivibrio sp. INlla18 TaxID=1520806 RepID=UPI00088107FD|nr:hypothetical protein [Butyrivibrio sp. INlla18]SDA62118.1 hypothetical protein SAMN02910275_01659 [Butyrivibrio sp. INlla18]
MKKRLIAALLAVTALTATACNIDAGKDEKKGFQTVDEDKEKPEGQVGKPSTASTSVTDAVAKDNRKELKNAGLATLSAEAEQIYMKYVESEGIEDYDFFDWDNDGEKELIVFDTCYYSMAAFDIKDGEPYISMQGEGTTGRLEFHKVDGEIWVCHGDYEHMGREIYAFSKYEGEGNKTAEIRFDAEFEHGLYDDDAMYYIDDVEADRATFFQKQSHYLDTEYYANKDRTIWLDEENSSFEWNGKLYNFTTEYVDEDCSIDATLTCGEDSLTTNLDENLAGNYVKNYVMIYKGKAYLYTFGLNETFGSQLYVYDLNQDSLKEPVKYEGEFNLESGNSIVQAPWSFQMSKISDMAGIGVVHVSFSVGDDGMPHINDAAGNGYFWYNDTFADVDIKVTAPIDCMKIVWNKDTKDHDLVKDDLEPGTVLHLYRTDDESYVDFQTDDEKIYRVYITQKQENQGSYMQKVSYIDGTTLITECMENLPVGA